LLISNRSRQRAPNLTFVDRLVERLIGTIRREYLDRVFFWNAADLAAALSGPVRAPDRRLTTNSPPTRVHGPARPLRKRDLSLRP